jgi:hypothetical protein
MIRVEGTTSLEKWKLFNAVQEQPVDGRNVRCKKQKLSKPAEYPQSRDNGSKAIWHKASRAGGDIR